MSTYHNTIELSVIIACNTTGTVEVEPSLLAFTNTKNCLVDITATVTADVTQSWLHVPAMHYRHK